MYIPKQENVIKLRNTLDILFLNYECGIMYNDKIIANYNDIEEEEKEIKYYDSPSKFINSGLGIIGIKRQVMLGNFIFHCGGCNQDMVYVEYNGKKSFNFKVREDLTVYVGACNSCNAKRINEWHKDNPEYLMNYAKERSKTDILFRLIRNIRGRTNSAYKQTTWKKTSKNKDMLGCSLSYAKLYLENKFTDGMSWDNYGKWHIDHIIPLSAADTEEELELLSHHKNLQPLWSSHNISKGGKYDKKLKAKMLKFIKNCKKTTF